MKLTTRAVLDGIASALDDQILPALGDGFAIEAARIATTLATMCANDVESAAAVRVEEHARIRALFADAAPSVSDEGLAAALAEAAGSRDTDLRISRLDIGTARLRRLLVALHVHVEERADEVARRIDRRIWSLLRETELSRAPRRDRIARSPEPA